jgi:hypothetical protein
MLAPEPVKNVAVKLVAESVVPVKLPDNETPDVGKTFDKFDSKVIPFLYIS